MTAPFLTSEALPCQIRRYLEKRGVGGPWVLAGEARRDFSGAIVIPALAEETRLPATLAGLSANPAGARSRFLVIVVVNHRADAAAADKGENFRTLRRLAAGEFASYGLPLAWVDAATPGGELPPRDGVGLARKIGFDLALDRLDFAAGPPVLASLDADTLVDGDYLPALLEHFRQNPAGGAVLPFRHQPGETPREEAAIARYELFLRAYVLGLSLAGSPYAYHTIGSALACRADAYAAAGGMNRRTGGEDFYFLQQLAKTRGVAAVRGTVVHPSSRLSTRVPFGTGAAMGRLVNGEDAARCYPPDAFRLLGRFLALTAAAWEESAPAVLRQAETIAPELAGFLRQTGFPDVWEKLQRNHRDGDRFRAAFARWFDALRTFRLLRHLAAGPCPRRPAEEVIPPLLAWAAREPPPELASQLECLRQLQNGEEISMFA